MSKFTEFISGLVDESKTFGKDELIQLIADAKKDESEFVRMQAENLERWTELLADGDLTSTGYKKLVLKMEVLTQLESLKLTGNAKAKAQNLASGIQTLVIGKLFSLLT